jgi:hypothetical protein
MNRILAAGFFVLTLSAPAFADTIPEGVQLRAVVPVGNGDPNAISCWAYRATPPVRGLQCARNSYWARRNAGLSDPGRFNLGPVGDVPPPPPPLRAQP